MTVEKISVKSVIEQAKKEVNEETSKKHIGVYKSKLRERASAQLLLDNIDREIAELELKMKHELM